MANKLVRYELGAGIGVLSTADSGRIVIGNSIPATTSTSMYGVAVDHSGNIFISDMEQSVIYRVDESGTPFLFAGTYGAEGNVDGVAGVAKFKTPTGLAVDNSGYVYVADNGNAAVRKIDKAGNVTTLASSVTGAFAVAVAANGNVYVSCTNHVVWQIKPNGDKLVLAGSAGVSGNVAGISGGAKVYGSTARFSGPTGIAVDRSGNVFVNDAGNDCIKKIYPDGWVVRYSGSGTNGNVLGVADSARFTSLGFMSIDPTGDLFVIDNNGAGSMTIKRIDRNGTVTKLSKTDDAALGIGCSPAGVLYVVESAGTGPMSSSSSSESTMSSMSLSTMSSMSLSTMSSMST